MSELESDLSPRLVPGSLGVLSRYGLAPTVDRPKAEPPASDIVGLLACPGASISPIRVLLSITPSSPVSSYWLWKVCQSDSCLLSVTRDMSGPCTR